MMTYISALERYQEYNKTIRVLLGSIVTGILDRTLIQDEKALAQSVYALQKNYSFVNLVYTLNSDGMQTSQNISIVNARASKDTGRGVDRSHRPYYLLAKKSRDVIVTDPYLSCDSHHLCISSALCCSDSDGTVAGYLVVDVDLVDIITFLMGDTRRRFFKPLFSTVYASIVVGLFVVVAILLYSAGVEIVGLFQESESDVLHLKPFEIIIFLTLALAVFDLGKTTLEEEILLRKDIFRHSSTRRTITRFIAAILIAVSIESLLLMFKSVLGSPQYLWHAVAMMATAIGLLVALGVYVYLGAKAEAILKKCTI